MTIKNDKEKMKLLDEWRCATKSYAYIYIFFGSVGVFIILISIITIMLPIHVEQPVNILYGFLTGIVITSLSLKLYSNKKSEIKSIRFTLEAVYVERKKIDLIYLDRISFVKKIKIGRPKTTMLLEFKMIFFPNNQLNTEVHFYMAFGKSIFSDQDSYDYESRFIDVLQNLAKERRENYKIGAISNRDQINIPETYDKTIDDGSK